jgi:hypothetical protein
LILIFAERVQIWVFKSEEFDADSDFVEKVSKMFS